MIAHTFARRLTTATVLTALGTSCVSTGGTTAGGPAPETAAFVVRLGVDTMAMERYTRTGNRIEGEGFIRQPGVTKRTFVIDLNPDGTVARYDYRAERVNGGPLAQHYVYEYGADSATLTFRRGDSAAVTSKVAAKQALPFVPVSYALMEIMTMRAKQLGGDSVNFAILQMGARQTGNMPVARIDDLSARVGFFGSPIVVKTDKQGRVLEANGMRTTQKFIATRVSDADVAAVMQAFAAREKAAGAMGAMSKEDTIRTIAGGANLTIAYGRPVARGRMILGDSSVGAVVPYGLVWRTGANFATHLTTDKDLVMGGTTIPAGTYTLWTLPTPSGWQLIVNRKIVDANGRSLWGTMYDASADLARIPLPSSRLSPKVDVFTIAVDPTSSGGTLRMMWDDFQLSMPFSVRMP